MLDGVGVKVNVEVGIGVLDGVAVNVEVGVRDEVGVNVTTAQRGAESDKPEGSLVRRYSSYSLTYLTC